MKHQWLATIALSLGISMTAPHAIAQVEIRQGVLLYNQLLEMVEDEVFVLSDGVLAELEDDDYFSGDFDLVYDAAFTILDGYTVVERSGFFPENRGVPLEAQLLRTEAVYHVFEMDNDYELVLFRSPQTDTAQYFIRTPRVVDTGT